MVTDTLGSGNCVGQNILADSVVVGAGIDSDTDLYQTGLEVGRDRDNQVVADIALLWDSPSSWVPCGKIRTGTREIRSSECNHQTLLQGREHLLSRKNDLPCLWRTLRWTACRI